MIRRLSWMVLGFALGFWSAFRLKRALRALTPKGLAHQAAGVGQSVREFAGDVRTAMRTREDELRDALGIDAEAHVDKDPH
jgi:hypothetical protein